MKFDIYDNRGKYVITVKKGYGNSRSSIYVGNKRVMECHFVPIQIPVEELPKLNNIKSINEIIEYLDHSDEIGSSARKQKDLRLNKIAELDFFVNCSNLQVWVENDYDTRLLDYRLSFPLLRAISWSGDGFTQIKFKEELTRRYKQGREQIRRYLEKGKTLEPYLDAERYKEYNDLYSALLEPKEEIALNLIRRDIDDCNITFKIKDGHIIHLELLNTKKISKELREFPHLEILKLIKGNNKELPSWFGQLSSLVKLGIYEFPIEVFPKEFGDLVYLEELILFGIKELTSLPLEFNNLSSLETLIIVKCNKFISLPKGIASCSKLREIKIKECKNLSTIPKDFGICPALKKLEIIDCPSLEKIPDEIGNLKALKQLTIKNCGLKSLSEGIGNLKKIEHIEIENCPLKELPESIGTLKSLIRLEIKDCLLEKLPKSIGNVITLNYLNLKNNQLKSFPESLANLTNLGLLFLDGNHWDQVPEHVFSIPNLGTLSLNDCGLKSLPEGLFKLNSLIALELNRNELEEIPSEIINLVNLKELGLANNKIKEFNDDLCNLPKLTYLSLIRNPLSSLPECIYKKEMILYIDDTNITFTENKASEIRKKVRSLGINSSQIEWGK